MGQDRNFRTVETIPASDLTNSEARLKPETDKHLRQRNGKQPPNCADIQEESPSTSNNGKFVPDIEGFYDRLIKEAPYIPGDKMELIPASEIPWANEALYKEGIKFGIRNFFPMLLAHTAALVFGFSVKPESVVLLRSGKFHTPEKSFLRYLSTGRRIGSWFGTNIFDPNSEGFKNMDIVRRMHTMYSKSKAPLPSLEEMGFRPEMRELMDAIHKDLSNLDIPEAPSHLLTWDPPLNFSQFDVALTQFGFVGLCYIHADVLGIPDMKFMDGYLHLWAVVGRLMGLEDRFNLALHPDKDLFMKIYKNIGIASIKTMDERVISLQYALFEGMSGSLFKPSIKSWFYSGLTEDEGQLTDGVNIWKIMTWRDKLTYYMGKAIIPAFKSSIIVRFFVNIVVAITLQFATWFYLPKKGCPFS